MYQRSWITKFVVALIAMLFFVSSRTLGIQYGSISGTIKDERGSVVPGASITLKSQETGQERVTTSDDEGRYNFPSVPPGGYEIYVIYPGFKRATKHVRVTVGGILSVDFTLTVGEIMEEVTVISPQATEVTRTDVSKVILEEEIINLPIAGRNFVDFVKLSSWVTRARGDQGGGAFQEPSVAVGAANALRLTFGGQNERFTLIQIDGVDNSQTITGLPRATPSQEAVREFRILNSSYSPEYGRFLAGLVNIITRSGGSSHHGSIYYFGMNDALNAIPLIAQHRFTLRQHQYGFSVGGPFLKAFYFANFEGQRRAESNIFSPVILNNLSAINLIRSRWNLEPETGDLLKINNYDTFLLRFDGNLTANNRLSFRYNLLDSKTLNFLGGGGRAAPTSSTRRNAFLRDQAAVVNVSSILSSQWLNEARFQYGRRSLDFPSVRNEPALEIPNLIIMGKSTSDFDFYRESLFQWTNALTYIYRRHEIKTGINANLFSDVADWFVFSPARVIFPGLPGFLGLPPFSEPTPVALQWTPAVGEDHPGISPKWDSAVPPRYKELMRFKYKWEHFGLFLQDKWDLHSGFSLIYGFRYDFDTFPQRFAERDYDNFQPRLGLSLRLGKMAIRGGFGIFHDVKRIPSHWAHALLVTGWHRASPVMHIFPFNTFLGNTAILTLVGPPVNDAFKRLIETGRFPPLLTRAWIYVPNEPILTDSI